MKVKWPKIIRRALFLFFLGSTLFVFGCLKYDQNEIEPISQEVIALEEPNRTCKDFNPLKNPYFGDTHVHSSYSMDAYFQNVRSTPADAYAYARGELIGLPPYDKNNNPLRTMQLSRPLDFAMVSDHAEYLGDIALCSNPNSDAYYAPSCFVYRNKGQLGFFWYVLAIGSSQSNPQRYLQPHCGPDGINCVNHSLTLWQEIQIAAEQAYDRSDECKFTSFVGYEWSGAPNQKRLGIVSQNLHRNVLFANAQVPERPSDYLSAPYPEDLWAALSQDCLNKEFAGSESCDVLTIPHNSNLSAGLMFEQLKKNGEPLDTEYSELRAQFEPIIELIQHKGNSECLYQVGGNDEECNFEYLPWGHLGGNMTSEFGFLGPLVLPWVDPQPTAFVRDALKEGLSIEKEIGVNPFKYGFIGSTDTHLAAPGLTDEKDYPGHGGAAGAGTTADGDLNTLVDNPEHNPGGLAVVWAEQNTRSAIFDAMKRKEVYATSGPRHILRFFGGSEYSDEVCQDPTLIEQGYAGGVPMGGTLTSQNLTDTAPKFIVSALKDTEGADLQYVQIIKGWVDENGKTHEKVYDIAGNKNNGAQVNLDTCATIGTGLTNICQVWQDPDFNPNEEAFYYTRVIENPTCRWNQHQCIRSNGAVGCDLKDVLGQPIAKTIKERSWSSPIWFNPTK